MYSNYVNAARIGRLGKIATVLTVTDLPAASASRHPHRPIRVAATRSPLLPSSHQLVQERAMQLFAWDGSLAFRLPEALAEALGIAEGDDVEITVEDRNTIVISKTGRGDLVLKLKVSRKA
jgi:antitoxin MazE